MNRIRFKISLTLVIVICGMAFAYIGGGMVNSRLPMYNWFGNNTVAIVVGVALALVYTPFMIVLHTIKNELPEKRVKEKQLLDLYFKAMIIVPLIIFPIWLYMTIKGDYSIKFH